MNSWMGTKGLPVRNTANGYRRILKHLVANGARVCLVTFPVFSLLRQEIKKIAGYGNVQNLFSRLAREKGIKYENFLLADYPDNYFSDPHHLNRRGAGELTSSVAKKCFSRTDG